jgi:hypothetical protein
MSDLIETLVEKISAYNVFNFMLPGAIFAGSYELMTKQSIFSGNIFLDVVIVYFAGMVISRIGSLIVEPLFKLTHILKFAKYEDYVTAEKKDPKLITLLQENNVYRNMTTVFIVLLLVKILIPLYRNYQFLHVYLDWACPILLIMLFTISYSKQTSYIRKRAVPADKK